MKVGSNSTHLNWYDDVVRGRHYKSVQMTGNEGKKENGIINIIDKPNYLSIHTLTHSERIESTFIRAIIMISFGVSRQTIIK